MLPSKEHTFILQTVNTYYHGYVSSQYDITHCRACWRQILPINTWYYQSTLVPFIEHSALLLLEIQDPQQFECISEVGFCVREGVKLCIAKEMEEQWRTEPLEGQGAAPYKHTKKDKVSAWRGLQSQANKILCMRHQRMAVGGRREGEKVVW